MNEAAATVQVMAETIVLLRREKDELLTQQNVIKQRLVELEAKVEELRNGEG